MNDNELDQRLLEYGERWRDAQPAVRPAKVTTPLRRRWLAPLAAAAAVAVVAAGVSVAVVHSRTKSASAPAGVVDLTGTVPWVAALAPPPYLPEQVAIPLRPATARACTATDVSVRLLDASGAMGMTIKVVTFTNVSRSTCLLSGWPRVTARSSGRPDVTAVHSKELTWSGSRPANIAPGETSQFSLGWSHACAQFGAKSADYYDELLVHLPGGTRLVHPSGLDRPELTCGLFEGRFMVQQKYVTPPNPLVGLHARLELPRTVHVGTTLTYVADLTNSTDHAIVLPRFCLGYLEALYPATAPAGRSTFDKKTHTTITQLPVTPWTKHFYGLNCASARTMDAHATVRYEMRLAAPTAAMRGRARVQWALEGSDLPQANAELTITG